MDQDRAAPSILQLRVVVRGISPLIWRRLLVSSDTTVADLHGIMQTVLDWSDEHLHCFRIHGKEYDYSDGRGPHAVRLSDFRLRCGERFVYVYNFRAWWQCDIRLEAVLPADPRQSYPLCTGGRRAGPPEESMAAFAAAGSEGGALVAVWDGVSRAGTRHMIDFLRQHGLAVYVRSV